MIDFENRVADLEHKINTVGNSVLEDILLFLKECEATSNSIQIANAYFLLAKYYLVREANHKKVGEYVSLFQNLDPQNSDTLLEAKFLRLKGFSCFNLGLYEEALVYFKESISLLETLQENEEVIIELGENYINLSLLQKSAKSIEIRQQLFNKALYLFEKANYNYGIGKCNNALGNIYFEFEDIPKAIEFYEIALSYHKMSDSLQGQGVVLNNLGTCHMKLGHFEKAINVLNRALEIKKIVGNPQQIANSYIHFGDVYFMAKDYKNALKYFSLAKDFFVTNDNKLELNNIYLKIAESYEELHDYKNGIEYLKLHLLLANDLKQFEKQKELNELIVKYEITKKAEETEALREKNIKIEEYSRLLEASNRDLQQFAHITSHDLREPLRMIGGYVGLLKKRFHENFTEEENEYIRYITKGVKRMDDLIRDILAYSKVDQSIDFLPIDLNEVLEVVLENLRTNINERNASITFEHLPVVLADKTQMIQLFQNIISNSLKYNRSETAIVNIQVFDEESEHIIKIEDNGIGIAPKHRIAVFDIFNRLHSGDEFSGTGMGLAICQKIVQKIGGSITIQDSNLGGVSFELKIPKLS